MGEDTLDHHVPDVGKDLMILERDLQGTSIS